jgi:tetratricopeptide (TPR) repeat protein
VKKLDLALCLALALVAGGQARGSGDEPIDTGSAGAPKSPAEIAAGHFNEGLSSRDQAWALQKKADDPALAPDKRQGVERKVRRAYEQAIASFERAIEADPAMYRAWSMLGYCRRQTGDYTAALAAYDRALELEPDYSEAIEYRGEAYLGLDRTDDARAAYERLAQADPALAAELLAAMETWVERRRADPGGVEPGAVEAFGRWVDARRGGAPIAAPTGGSRGW